MSEGSFSRRLRNKLAPKLVVWERIENSVGEGTPDVYGESERGAFWCELKHLHDYPARPTTAIRFKRYTKEQADKIEMLGESGKVGSWILIQVAGDHWLFHWSKAHELQKLQPLTWWEENAYCVWKGRLDYNELAKVL